jgi:hypothetical protein
MRNKVVLVFFDGIGIDSKKTSNPFPIGDMKYITSIVGGSLTSEHFIEGPKLVFKGLDACLGIKGIPQSATGQTALFAGINAPVILGYHFPAFPNKALRDILQKNNLFKEAVETGIRATFANAYTPGYFELVQEGKRKHSVTTISVMASGLPFRRISDLQEGRAVYWDITNRYLQEKSDIEIPTIDPFSAGMNLAALLDENDLVVFESFLPDIIGHRRSLQQAVDLCSLMDRFIEGIVSGMCDKSTLVIASDHGNMEDMSTSAHTKNPALFISIGENAGAFSGVEAITGIKSTILSILSGIS